MTSRARSRRCTTRASRSSSRCGWRWASETHGARPRARRGGLRRGAGEGHDAAAASPSACARRVVGAPGGCGRCRARCERRLHRASAGDRTAAELHRRGKRAPRAAAVPRAARKHRQRPRGSHHLHAAAGTGGNADTRPGAAATTREAREEAEARARQAPGQGRRLMAVAGRYEIIRPLGHGAMALVDLARDVELDRPVALKRLADNLARDDELHMRFLREARLAARLAHPNIVRVYDVGDDDGVPFIAMEYVEGETVAELLARRGVLHEREAATLGEQIFRALAAAHVAGLVHRDVKPQNLLLRDDGVLKLSDFGVAVGLGGTRLTMAGTVLGTAAYLAPEQARGEDVTPAADVYAGGAVLYELLTGSRPRAVTSLAELGHPGPVVPPPALADLVLACLAADPRDRPAAELVARRLAGGAPEAATLRIARSRRSRSSAVIAAIALLAIVGGIVAALVSTGGNSSKPAPRPVARVAPVPHASRAEQQARNLAAWLRRYENHAGG